MYKIITNSTYIINNKIKNFTYYMKTNNKENIYKRYKKENIKEIIKI